MSEQKNNNQIIILSTAFIVLVFTALNIGATHYLIQENNYKTYGGKKNFELVSTLQGFQLEKQFEGVKDSAELKKKLEEQFGAVGNNGDQQANKPATNYENPVDMSKLSLNTPVYGKKDAKISIYEFSDLECPYCQDLHNSGIIKKAVENNPEDVNYVYKNFQFHQGAPMKAQAALCAGELKGEKEFFNFIDSIFKVGTRATKEDILKIGEDAGISSDEINKCLDSGKYSSAIQSDYEQGINFGVTGTPTVVVINNETGKWEVLTSRSLESLQALIDELKK